MNTTRVYTHVSVVTALLSTLAYTVTLTFYAFDAARNHLALIKPTAALLKQKPLKC